jgi:hypothetical protein
MFNELKRDKMNVWVEECIFLFGLCYKEKHIKIMVFIFMRYRSMNEMKWLYV